MDARSTAITKFMANKNPAVGQKCRERAPASRWLWYADKVTGHKEIRAEPLAAQVQGGNVHLVAGEYVSAFLDELEVLASGRTKSMLHQAHSISWQWARRF